MPESDDIAQRFWSLPQKPGEEARREELFMDDIIQRAHVSREIEHHLDGVQTVFDGGAGVGRFSIPLALRGLRVVHFDISAPMLQTAREAARERGVEKRMTFVKGSLEKLSQFDDGEFDLVISIDAPVSYTFPRHEEVLSELVRISSRAVVVSVSSRLGYAACGLSPAPKTPYLVDEQSADPQTRFYTSLAARRMAGWTPDLAALEQALQSGLLEGLDGIRRAFDAGHAPWPPNYLFLPEELRAILERAGLRHIRCAGPGALSRSIPAHVLRELLLHDEHRSRFLDLCYQFDSRPSVCGLGKDNLVASGVRP